MELQARDDHDGIPVLDLSLDARQDGISKSIQDMNDQIGRLESRITREGDRMRRQFIAMEAQLAQYQGLGDYVTNALAQLGNARK